MNNNQNKNNFKPNKDEKDQQKIKYPNYSYYDEFGEEYPESNSTFGDHTYKHASHCECQCDGTHKESHDKSHESSSSYQEKPNDGNGYYEKPSSENKGTETFRVHKPKSTK